MLTVGQWLLASVIVTAGAVVQGSIGFGLGLLGAPLLLLIEPRLVPGPLLSASLLLTTLLTRREWHGVRFGDLGWALPGRVLGTVLALIALRLVPVERTDLLVGGVILVAVALTGSGLRLLPAPGTLLGAGALAGFLGTTSSVGGPPIALVYQHETGPRIRGTLSAFFVVGVVLSLIGLHVVDRFGAVELRLALALLPAAVAGFLLSRRTARWVDAGRTRLAVLAASGASGLFVVVRELV